MKKLCSRSRFSSLRRGLTSYIDIERKYNYHYKNLLKIIDSSLSPDITVILTPLMIKANYLFTYLLLADAHWHKHLVMKSDGSTSYYMGLFYEFPGSDGSFYQRTKTSKPTKLKLQVIGSKLS